MYPNYVAKKSVVPALNILLILTFWLVIPLIIQIYKIVEAKNYRAEFYDDKVIIKGGVFSTSERQSVFAGVHSVSIYKSLLGRMFNYGDIRVDAVGKWDVDTYGISNPDGLKHYLETQINKQGMQNIVFN